MVEVEKDKRSKFVISYNASNAKPFVKWAGGKSQLLGEILGSFPLGFRGLKDVVYVEPFIGGGAVLFAMLKNFSNIEHAVANDINPRLMTTYKIIKFFPQELIEELLLLQEAYHPLSHEARTEMFLAARRRFNEGQLDDVQIAAYFIFLNRTCFNGLYRENAKGEFNVPHGRYRKPLICDESTIMADSELLQKVELLCGDFSNTLKYADARTFYYFDPPYKPLSATSSFNSYVKESFGDEEQVRLRFFCDEVSRRGSLFLLSNSDLKGKDANDNFFDDLYASYSIKRVYARRAINANPAKRGCLSELLVTNISSNEVGRERV